MISLSSVRVTILSPALVDGIILTVFITVYANGITCPQLAQVNT